MGTSYRANCLLVAEVGLLCLARQLAELLYPAAILPQVSIPMLVLLSVIPLTADYYLGTIEQQNWGLSTLLAGATFGLLPWCAGSETGQPFWVLFLVGGAAFGVTSLLYGSMARRMVSSSSTPALAPAIHGFGLYLVSQGLLGLL